MERQKAVNEKTGKRIKSVEDTKAEYTARVDELAPTNEGLDASILRMEKEKRENKVIVANEEQEKDKKLI